MNEYRMFKELGEAENRKNLYYPAAPRARQSRKQEKEQADGV
jgi:hypothetical protein